jgi:hypothetical protein
VMFLCKGTYHSLLHNTLQLFFHDVSSGTSSEMRDTRFEVRDFWYWYGKQFLICTSTSGHQEFQRKKGKTYILAASAILFIWVTNGVILTRVFSTLK